MRLSQFRVQPKSLIGGIDLFLVSRAINGVALFRKSFRKQVFSEGILRMLPGLGPEGIYRGSKIPLLRVKHTLGGGGECKVGIKLVGMFKICRSLVELGELAIQHPSRQVQRSRLWNLRESEVNHVDASLKGFVVERQSSESQVILRVFGIRLDGLSVERNRLRRIAD